MMSFFGDLFGGGDSGNAVTTVNNSASWPKWYDSVMKNFLNNANTIASNPYTPNPNQRVAPLTNDQNSAYSTVRNMQGAYQPTLNYATGLGALSGAGFDSNAFNSYMNPYTDNVVNQIGTLAQRNLSENLLPAVNDSFIRAGQFGSRGNIDLTGRALRDTQEAALNQQGQLLNQGFQQQVQNMQQGQQNQNNAAQTLGQLAQTGQQLGLQGAAAQEAAGSAQQQQGQKNLDVANQDFMEQRDWAKNNATWLSSLLQGNSPPQNSTSTSTQNVPGASPLTQVVGAIGGISSLLSSFMKSGGAVKGYADGGVVTLRPEEYAAIDNQLSSDADGGISPQELNAAGANAFATWGNTNRAEMQDPERQILRLVAEFGIPEDEARALVYSRSGTGAIQRGYAGGGSVGLSDLRCG